MSERVAAAIRFLLDSSTDRFVAGVADNRLSKLKSQS
ncbi:unnamed protein product [Rhodiola kirilowii]